MRTHSLTTPLFALSLLLAPACSGDGGDESDDRPPPDAGTPAPDTEDDPNRDAEAAELAVTSVQPASGSAEGGTTVAISGTGFTDGATVTFGGEAAPDVEVVSSFDIEATTPPADSAGTVDIRVELADGESATLSDGFEYTAPAGPSVGWCNLQFPESMTATAGSETDPMYGRVYAEGCTDGDQHCEAIEAQLGVGDPSTDPTEAPGDYDWMQASYNPDHTEDDNDEYQAAVTPAEAGTRAYLYRFRSSADDDWQYCDLDGSDNGFSTDQMGELTVEAEQTTPEVEVGWCNLQYPPEVTVDEGTETPTIYSRVYVEGCTEDGDQGRVQCEAVTGELGWGPTDVDPADNPEAYDWTEATYNDQFPPEGSDNNNDEHQATLQPDQTGQFAYLYRYSGDGGDTWTYCDLDGSPYSADQLGSLTVE